MGASGRELSREERAKRAHERKKPLRCGINRTGEEGFRRATKQECRMRPSISASVYGSFPILRISELPQVRKDDIMIEAAKKHPYNISNTEIQDGPIGIGRAARTSRKSCRFAPGSNREETPCEMPNRQRRTHIWQRSAFTSGRNAEVSSVGRLCEPCGDRYPLTPSSRGRFFIYKRSAHNPDTSMRDVGMRRCCVGAAIMRNCNLSREAFAAGGD